MDHSAYRVSGAGIDQEIEQDLPHAFDGDWNAPWRSFTQSNLNALSRGLWLDEQPKIVDIDSAQRIVASLSPIRH